MRNKVLVNNKFPKRIQSAQVRKAVHALLRDEGVEGVEVSILICDDTEIHRLNRSFRSVDEPTDVLAFPMDQITGMSDGQSLLGDVAVSIEAAERQAREQGHTTDTECVLLVLHGVLHLLGYQDQTESDARRMLLKAEGLARHLGFQPCSNYAGREART